jgi:hypothetical protein
VYGPWKSEAIPDLESRFRALTSRHLMLTPLFSVQLNAFFVVSLCNDPLPLTKVLEQVHGPGPPPFWNRDRIIVAVGEALADLHEHGIVHGRLSTDTVCLDSNGEVVIGDYAINEFEHCRLEEPNRLVIRPEVSKEKDMEAFGRIVFQI